jgi:hypothetical protein
MEKAEELFSIVCAGQQQQRSGGERSKTGGGGDAEVSLSAAADGGAGAVAGLAVVSSDEYALYSRKSSEKVRVKAGTCILKDFGRTAKNPTLKDLSCAQSFSKRAEWELEQERLRKTPAEASETTADSCVAGRSEKSSEPATASTTLASPSPASLGEEEGGTGSAGSDAAEDGTQGILDAAEGTPERTTDATKERTTDATEERTTDATEERTTEATEGTPGTRDATAEGTPGTRDATAEGTPDNRCDGGEVSHHHGGAFSAVRKQAPRAAGAKDCQQCKNDDDDHRGCS